MTTILSGEVVTAGKLNRLQPTTYELAATDNLTLTTSETDIPGATIDIDTERDDAVYTVTGCFDFDCQSTNGGVLIGRLQIEGATQAREAHGSGVTVARSTGIQIWTGQLGAAGTYTFTLRGLRTGSTGTQQIRTLHTSATVVITEAS